MLGGPVGQWRKTSKNHITYHHPSHPQEEKSKTQQHFSMHQASTRTDSSTSAHSTDHILHLFSTATAIFEANFTQTTLPASPRTRPGLSLQLQREPASLIGSAKRWVPRRRIEASLTTPLFATWRLLSIKIPQLGSAVKPQLSIVAGQDKLSGSFNQASSLTAPPFASIVVNLGGKQFPPSRTRSSRHREGGGCAQPRGLSFSSAKG